MEPQLITLILLGIVIVLLITEWIPMAVTGILIPIVLVTFNILTPENAFLTLGAPLILLVSSAFIFGAAFFKVGLADIVGSWIWRMADRFAHGSEKFVIALVMAVTAALSSVLPNLGVVAALLPVFLAVAASTGIATGRILMPVAFASSLGGTLTLIGSPNNLIGRGALEASNAGSFGFFEFAWIGIPFTILGILYVATIGTRWLPGSPSVHAKTSIAGTSSPRGGRPAGSIGGAEAAEATSSTRNSPGTAVDTMIPGQPAITEKPRRSVQILTLALFTIFILGISLESVTGVASYIVGFICIAVLVITRVLPEKEVYKSISWSTLFFIVGILTLAQAVVSTGASQILANGMLSALGGAPTPIVLTGGLFLISAILTQFMSNTATTGMLAPIAISIAVGMEGDPKALVMAVVIGASCAFVTVLGTPANMMVAEAGNIKFMDWVRCGWPLLVIGFVISVIILPLVFPYYG